MQHQYIARCFSCAEKKMESLKVVVVPQGGSRRKGEREAMRNWSVWLLLLLCHQPARFHPGRCARMEFMPCLLRRYKKTPNDWLAARLTVCYKQMKGTSMIHQIQWTCEYWCCITYCSIPTSYRFAGAKQLLGTTRTLLVPAW